MTTLTTLGIDISKKKFDVALLNNGKLKNKKVTNHLQGFKDLLQWLNKHDGFGCYF
jgi:transposase